MRCVQGVGLCHGIAGNGYSLLSLYRLTGDEAHLCRAQHFGAFAAEHWRQLYDVPDSPASLYLVNGWPSIDVSQQQSPAWCSARVAPAARLRMLRAHPFCHLMLSGAQEVAAWLRVVPVALRRVWRERSASGLICRTRTTLNSLASSCNLHAAGARSVVASLCSIGLAARQLFAVRCCPESVCHVQLTVRASAA